MAVSKRLRHEVFRRDDNTCQTCGRRAPDVEITIDHVIPQALGGTDEPSNLVTACRDCNSGKSSSSPDAPLVAQVAEDARRWSAAMTVAAGEMLAKASDGVDAQEHFARAWARYGTGEQRTPLPKDAAWRQTVESLLSAGLSLSMLDECIDIAMSRRVAEENVFRYMCGVAWRKVTELQTRARQLVQPESGEAQDECDDPADEAVQNWCRVILGQREAAYVEIATSDSLGYAGDQEPSSVLWFVIQNLETDRESIMECLRDLMNALPGDLGVRLLKEHEAFYRAREGAYRPSTPLVSASQWAAEHMQLARARQEMACMPRGEYEAWVQRSRDEHADIADHLSDSFYVLDGARMAREPLAASSTQGA